MKIKKFISLVVSLAIIATMPIPAMAIENDASPKDSVESILSLPKGNITFIEGSYSDLHHLVYTYTSNGETYKVIENANDTLTHVSSIIYVKDTSGRYKEFTKQLVDVNNSVVNYTIIANGKQSVDTTNLLPEKPDYNNKESVTNNRVILNSTYDGLPVTPWVYWGQSKTSTNITRYTIAAVGALITGIVSASSLGTAATITYTVIDAIVQKICDDCIPKVWYTDDVYNKYIQSPTYTNRVAELTYHD